MENRLLQKHIHLHQDGEIRVKLPRGEHVLFKIPNNNGVEVLLSLCEYLQMADVPRTQDGVVAMIELLSDGHINYEPN